ncbi:myosin-2 heavy chain isoform X1 [Selaginella moellendorffii]|uniref:myosin-2 heavy chain isoform X1 n=2 Tax=Selaginella moellendorffii TaxID=88036 RepID=UPI000D1C6630|nr:myosin-2 heavy chain isoform X1 [Selaginella moellendorffii]XP_024534062.1 myosin-2 heavy chain isoform X1 [Selaginella moellendorffii]XP_024534063.1 myosin-2 heavy chain isoform X1 [Selaginella moellendorffii]XP_024534064.1 myosin-2 heavy chain isoform X1 [Selaginella moellendorffii]XP_024534065.1 myosin-2 heavy chain isoform X1 [Selaginella moellendorffii]|eukprot:XP_024534061.1 myosin-2 heavy chain isoform X1 [Selaginella moellendorffii]
MDASRSKDSLRAAGKKRLEEFRLKRQQQRVESKNADAAVAATGEESGSAIKDESGTVQNENEEPEILDSQNLDRLEPVQKDSTSMDLQSQDVLEHGRSHEMLEKLHEDIRVAKQEKEQVLAERNSLSLKVEELDTRLRSVLLDEEKKLRAMTVQLESCVSEKTGLDSALASSRQEAEEAMQRTVAEFERLISLLGSEAADIEEVQTSSLSGSVLDNVRMIKEGTKEKERELQDLRVRVEELEGEKGVVESSLSASAEELARLKTQVASEREEHREVIAAKNLAIEEDMVRLRSREQEVLRVTEERDSLSAELAALSQKVDELDGCRFEMQDLEASIQHLRQELNDAEKREGESLRELQSVKAQLDQLKIDNETKLDQRDKEIGRLGDEKARFLDQLTVLDKEARARQMEMVADCQDLKQQLENARKREKDVVAKLESLENQLRQEKQRVENTEEQEKLSREKGDVLAAENSRLVDQLTSLSQELKQQLGDAKKREEDVVAKLESLENQLRQEKQRVESTEEQEKLSREKGDALAAESSRLVYQLTSLSQELKQQLEDAKKREEDLVAKLESLESQLQHEKQRVESTEEQEKIIRGKVDALVAENSRLLDQLTSLQDLKVGEAELRTTHVTLEESQKEMTVELEALKDQLLALQKSSSKELTAKSDMIEDLRKRVEDLQDENSGLKSSYENRSRFLEEQIRSLEQQLDNSSEKEALGKDVLESRLHIAFGRLGRLEDGYLDTLCTLDSRLTSHEEKFVRELEELASLHETYAERLDEDNLKLQSGFGLLEKKLADQTENVKRLVANVIEDSGENTSVETCVLALIDMVKKSEEELQRLRSQQIDLNEELTSLRLEQQSDVVTANQTKAEVTRLLEREQSLLDELSQANLLGEQLRLQLETCQEEAKNKFDELSKECGELRRRVANLDETLTSVKLERDFAAQSMAKQEAEILETVRVMQEDLATANLVREQLQFQLEKSKEVALRAEKDAQIAASSGKRHTEERDALKQTVADLEVSCSACKQQLADCEKQQKLLITSCEEKNACIQKIGDIISTAWIVPVDFEKLNPAVKGNLFAGEFLQTRERASGAETEVMKSKEKIALLKEELKSLTLEKDNALQTLETSRSEYSKLERILSQEKTDRQSMEMKVGEFEAKLHGLRVRLSSVLLDEMATSTTAESEEFTELDHCVSTLIATLAASVKTNEELLLQQKLLEDSKLELQAELSSRTEEMKNLQDQKNHVVLEVKQIKEELDSAMDRFQRGMAESEQRLATVREKLGLAVKKGKGVAQQRDDLKQLLAQKSEELERSNKQLSALEASVKEKLLQVESIQKSSVEKQEALKATILGMEIGACSKQEEINSCKTLLQESCAREKKLAAELNVLRRKCAETLEEKQLLEESKRHAWLELEREAARLKEFEASETRLTASLITMEEKNNRLQKELSSATEDLTRILALQSENFAKKLATLTDVDMLLASLQQLLWLDRDTKVFSKKPSSWDDHEDKVRLFKPASMNTSEMFKTGFELMKGAQDIELAVILESASIIKQLLHEILTEIASRRKETTEALETKEQDLLSYQLEISSKDREIESLRRESDLKFKQLEELTDRVEELETLIEQNHLAMDNMETSRNKAVGKLTFTVNKFKELQQQCEAMLAEIERLQMNLDSRHAEHTALNQKVEILQNDLKQRTENSMQLERSLKALTAKAAVGQRGEQLLSEPKEIVDLLDAQVQRLLHENENLQLSIKTKDSELQKLKDKFLPVPSVSEIEELEQPKHMTVPSAPHIRAQKKMVVGDQVAIDMDAGQTMEIEEKGNAFKSLGMIRFLPKASHHIGDRVDELSISAGRLLMRQPVARLSLIVYWIAIHVWIAATVTMAKI